MGVAVFLCIGASVGLGVITDTATLGAGAIEVAVLSVSDVLPVLTLVSFIPQGGSSGSSSVSPLIVVLSYDLPVAVGLNRCVVVRDRSDLRSPGMAKFCCLAMACSLLFLSRCVVLIRFRFCGDSLIYIYIY